MQSFEDTVPVKVGHYPPIHQTPEGVYLKAVHKIKLKRHRGHIPPTVDWWFGVQIKSWSGRQKDSFYEFVASRWYQHIAYPDTRAVILHRSLASTVRLWMWAQDDFVFVPFGHSVIWEKISNFHDYICKCNADLVAVTETWLEIQPPGYKLVNFPRPGRRGAVTARL